MTDGKVELVPGIVDRTTMPATGLVNLTGDNYFVTSASTSQLGRGSGSLTPPAVKKLCGNDATCAGICTVSFDSAPATVSPHPAMRLPGARSLRDANPRLHL